MPKKLTQEEFIAKARSVHGDKYDYSKAEYVNNRTDVIIICPIHGEFKQTPDSHMSGRECQKCGKIKASKNKKYTLNEFIEKSNQAHNNKYDYSITDYKGCYEPVEIICPIHGVFTQTPYTHIYGVGCPKCTKYYHKGIDGYLTECAIVHGNKYDYSLVDFKNHDTPVDIICPTHGVFRQRLISHIQGQGCPHCKESKGEKKIANWLDINNISYIRQYKLHPQQLSLIGRNVFLIDFYLDEYNIAIEFNGEQHYKRNNFFHRTEDRFRAQLYRDKQLKKYCNQYGIKLIEIPYTKIKEIDKILDKELGRLK